MRHFRWIPVLTALALLMASAPIASPMRAMTPNLPERNQSLYVNAATGDDKDSCETPAHACRTLQAAFDRIPPVLTQEVTVNVAAGRYAGGALLMDRSSPRDHPIRIVGEKGVTFLEGLDQIPIGIAVYRAPRVFVDGLSVTGFRRAGLSLVQTAPIVVSSTRVISNGGVGLEIRDTEAVILETVVSDNVGDGILCDDGGLALQALNEGKGVVVSGNGGHGIWAVGCHVSFEGPSMIVLNRGGLVAEHGAEINLMGRTDVVVTGNTLASGGGAPPPGDPRGWPAPLSHLPLCELTANNHGLVAGYGNAQMGDACLCLDSHFGVCDPD